MFYDNQVEMSQSNAYVYLTSAVKHSIYYA